MSLSHRARRLLLALITYLIFCSVSGVFLADEALHPARRPLTDEDLLTARNTFHTLAVDLTNVSITVPDGTTLAGWILKPQDPNGNAVIVLHGLGDNRLGMMGYARLFLAHGYTVLLPDARAHGVSGGQLATYGLLERNDIHRWLEWLNSEAHPRCVLGFGESLGAAELLQSLATHARFCAVAAESSFADFREIAYDRMGQPFHTGPWLGRTLFRPIVEVAFLRARWKYGLEMQQVSPEESVAASHVPVLLIHGRADSNIPIRHSRIIHARDPGASLWEVPNADHCGAISVAPGEFEQEVLQWFSRKPEEFVRTK
jgi:fermentation-respiration switch protein FrsA (DUF1100 family)